MMRGLMIFSKDVHFFILGGKGFVANNLLCDLRKLYSTDQISTINPSLLDGGRIAVDRDIDSLRDHIVGEIDRHNKRYRKYYLVNLISASNVDWCEKNPEKSLFINYQYPKKLVEYFTMRDDVVYMNFSSNAVYDGKNPTYGEASVKNPVNIYGTHKAKFDDYLQSSAHKFITIRPTTLYGNVTVSRSNPVIDLCRKAIFSERVRLVDDLTVNFGYVGDLTKLLTLVFESEKVNFELNFGGTGSYSRYDLGKLIYSYFGRDISLIERCSLKDFDQNIQRPANTTFDCSFLNSFNLKSTRVEDFIHYNYSHLLTK
jgi:dTDP-4-dehydrorhamnose reductase